MAGELFSDKKAPGAYAPGALVFQVDGCGLIGRYPSL